MCWGMGWFGVVEVKVNLAKNVVEMDGTVVEVEGFLWGFC